MQASSKIRYLDKELIRSDSFHTIGAGTTTLVIEYGGEQVAIEFIVKETNDGTVNTPISAKVVSTDRLQVYIENYRQVLPSQTIGPVELGTLVGRVMTLVVEVRAVRGNASKHIGYSLYLGGANG